jgi:hypothetical protein
LTRKRHALTAQIVLDALQVPTIGEKRQTVC